MNRADSSARDAKEDPCSENFVDVSTFGIFLKFISIVLYNTNAYFVTF